MQLIAPRDSRVEKSLPILLLTAGMNNHQEPRYRLDGAEYHHIFYVEKGQGILETSDGKFDMEEGTAIFMREFVPMNYYAKGEVFDAAWVTFIGQDVNRILDYFTDENFVFLKSESIYSKIVNICKMVSRGKSADILSKYAYDILITFFSEYHSAQKPPMLIRAKEYMDQNFGEQLSVSDVARQLGISESLLFKLFRENEDLTPTEYLRSVRLRYAEQMLLSAADVRISDVAEKCGFSDSAYFCKVFKDETGMTPKNYQSKYMQ